MRYIHNDLIHLNRYVPECAEDLALLRAFICQVLRDRADWRPLRGEGAAGNGWEWCLQLIDEQTDGVWQGYLETRPVAFDAGNDLDGDAIRIELWVMDGPGEACIWWRVPKTKFGGAQENYLPHLPVLYAAD